MENTSFASKLNFFTVKQLSELFGKSEDTIRRWKNEGIGKGEDNVKLHAVEQAEPDGRRGSRHLCFSRSAVRDFVQANPFLMDDAPQLRSLMEEKRERAPRVIALPSDLERMRGEMPGSGEEEETAEEDSFARIRRLLGEAPFGDDGYDDDFDEEPEDDDPFGGEGATAGERQRRYDEDAIRYMLHLLREREAACRYEMGSARGADTLFFRRGDVADALADRGSYVRELVRRREEALEDELEKIRETTRALERLLR